MTANQKNMLALIPTDRFISRYELEKKWEILYGRFDLALAFSWASHNHYIDFKADDKGNIVFPQEIRKRTNQEIADILTKTS